MKAKYTYRGVVMRTDPSRARATTGKASVSRAGGSFPSPPPAEARVRVGREVAGRGGKAVSVITGLPLTGEDLDALATQLKKLCGAGGAVRDGTIEIQGDHRDRLVSELQKRGYQAKRSGG